MKLRFTVECPIALNQFNLEALIEKKAFVFGVSCQSQRLSAQLNVTGIENVRFHPVNYLSMCCRSN